MVDVRSAQPCRYQNTLVYWQFGVTIGAKLRTIHASVDVMRSNDGVRIETLTPDGAFSNAKGNSYV